MVLFVSFRLRRHKENSHYTVEENASFRQHARIGIGRDNVTYIYIYTYSMFVLEENFMRKDFEIIEVM